MDVFDRCNFGFLLYYIHFGLRFCGFVSVDNLQQFGKPRLLKRREGLQEDKGPQPAETGFSTEGTYVLYLIGGLLRS